MKQEKEGVLSVDERFGHIRRNFELNVLYAEMSQDLKLNSLSLWLVENNLIPRDWSVGDGAVKKHFLKALQSGNEEEMQKIVNDHPYLVYKGLEEYVKLTSYRRAEEILVMLKNNGKRKSMENIARIEPNIEECLSLLEKIAVDVVLGKNDEPIGLDYYGIGLEDPEDIMDSIQEKTKRSFFEAMSSGDSKILESIWKEYPLSYLKMIYFELIRLEEYGFSEDETSKKMSVFPHLNVLIKMRNTAYERSTAKPITPDRAECK